MRWCESILAGPGAELDRRGAQLRRRQRLHRAGRLRRHRRHRRASRPNCSVAPAQQVAVGSTGLIGLRLPMDKLLPGIDERRATALSPTAGLDAADAIMTTDTVPKTAQVTRRRVHRRRDGQGRRHAGARPGHHAGGADHRRGRRLRRRWTPRCGRRPGCPSTGSTPTAPCPPTTPCCCWPPAPPASSPTPELLRRRGHPGLHRTWPSSCWPTPRAPPRRSPSRWCTPPPRTTPSRWAARSPATTW